MIEKLTVEVIALQEQLSIRLRELGYGDQASADHMSRQLASIAVLGKAFAESTVPLFLSVNPQHADALADLSTSIKCELEEMSDAIVDVDPDLRSLMQFLDSNRR
jgi:hypothetical protein